MLNINPDDVIAVLRTIQTQLIVIGVTLVIAIVVIIAAMKIAKPLKGLVRGTAVLAWLLVVLIMANMICTGPMRDTLDKVSATSYIEDATSAEATELVSEIVEEGVVLAKNVDGILPIVSGSKLNVFGWASTNPCYGGTGSGALNAAYPTTDLLTGLKNAGIETNAELSQFYTDYCATRPTVAMWVQDWTIVEPAASAYPQTLIDNAKAFSDTAMIVITRVGGEGADLPTDMMAVVDGSWKSNAADAGYFAGTYNEDQNEGPDWDEGDHFLQLTNQEEQMVELVCSNFDNVVVVYNGANAFEMDFVNDYPQIKGVLLCPGTGQSGFDGFGRVVSGAVNPSGRTVDTYVTDLKNAPWWNNFGYFKYTNMDEFKTGATMFDPNGAIPTFVNYVEGIYVGYKFYETAAEEGLIDYDAEVVYPFGYGLSYTTFEQTLDSVTYDGTNVNYSVTVKNTGSVAGKDVVELYVTPPYTNGGIEKAAVNLVAFDKTDMLEPGASQVVTLSFDKEDIASYDTYGIGGYILEAGSYEVSLRTDAHTVVDSFTFDVASDVTYDLHNGDLTSADPVLNFAEGGITYLSRADGFANYAEATAGPATYSLDRTTYDVTANGTYDPYQYNNDSDTMPTTGANKGVVLADLRGKAFDDPQWDDLLDELTVSEMVNLIGYGGFATVEAASIEKYATIDSDGPAGVNYSLTGAFGMGYCGEILLAQTWNTELAYKMADGICQEFVDFGFNGWYAPSMNLHRSPFAGRNFEYYSEDSLLSAEMALEECAAAYPYGVYPYIKHFAFNEQETNRNGILCTWLTEQAARELYLEPFEECVKANRDMGGSAAGYPLAVMSSYVYVGTTWDGGCDALLNGILRTEWGYNGLVLTDYFGNYGYMDADKAIRGGSDSMLGTAGNDAILTDQESATSVLAMRKACHDLLYTVVNSNAYTAEAVASHSSPAWLNTLYIVDGAIAIVLVLCEVLAIRSLKKKKETA